MENGTDSTTIISLAKTIVQNTQVVDEYLRGNNLPTFDLDDADAPVIPPTAQCPEAEAARHAAMAAAEELQNLLGGAFAPLTYDWTGLAVTRTIVKLGVATLVPLMGLNTTAAGGAEKCAINASSTSANTDAGLISMSSLAALAGLPEPLLRRLLRHAMTRHIFREPREGFVAHTAASAALARVASPPREAFQFAVEDLWPAGLRLADAIARWPASDEPTESGFAVAHAEEGEGGQELKSLWQVLQLDAAKARRFGGMVELEASFVAFPLHEAEWSGTVVDVGGGSGAVSVELARRFPDARFIVQDLASVIQGREAEVPSDVKGRVQFMAHDLFSEQPVVGADIYFLRWICHDWSSKYAIQIIRNLIPALKHGARVRLNEGLMPRPGALPRRLERAIRDMDIAMMAQFNGQERDLDEWKDLFAQADTRFKFVSVDTAPPGLMGLIEFEWDTRA